MRETRWRKIPRTAAFLHTNKYICNAQPPVGLSSSSLREDIYLKAPATFLDSNHEKSDPASAVIHLIVSAGALVIIFASLQHRTHQDTPLSPCV